MEQFLSKAEEPDFVPPEEPEPEPNPDAAGTEDDPIDVAGDVEKAAQLLGEGKHVRLRQVDEVSTLLDKLGGIVKEAREKGEKAPLFDLCKVSVPGTNLFCVHSKGIKRVEMPQLKGVPKPGTKAAAMPLDESGKADLTEEFLKHLVAGGSEVEADTVPASHLRASQHELDGGKVAGMVDAVRSGAWDGGTESLVISEDNYIVDGHHRWATKVGLDLEDGKLGDEPIGVQRLDWDIIELLAEANRFTEEWGIGRVAVGGSDKESE